ncbi:MAG: TetR/AcrR family transcriptional regulator [Chloroflexota bacterium]
MDKRIQRTRKLLGNVLVELLQEKPFHQITVRQITERAGVAYSTFFRNFEDTGDLLQSYLNNFLQDLRNQSYQAGNSNLQLYSRENVKAIFQHVQKYPNKYWILLKTPAIQPMLNELQEDVITHNFDTISIHNPNAERDVPLNLILYNDVKQLFNIIEWWLDNDLSTHIDDVVSYYEQLVIKPAQMRLVNNPQMMKTTP